MIRLSKHTLDAIRRHGSETFPHECVGVLLGTIEAGSGHKIVHEARPLPNTFEPSAEFERSIFDHKEPQHQELQSGSQEKETAEVVGQERRYLLSPDTMFALIQEERRTKRKILGFYHSHPNHPARPSVYDREWASPWYTYIIVSILDGKDDALTAWQLTDDRAAFDPEQIEEIDTEEIV